MKKRCIALVLLLSVCCMLFASSCAFETENMNKDIYYSENYKSYSGKAGIYNFKQALKKSIEDEEHTPDALRFSLKLKSDETYGGVRTKTDVTYVGTMDFSGGYLRVSADVKSDVESNGKAATVRMKMWLNGLSTMYLDMTSESEGEKTTVKRKVNLASDLGAEYTQYVAQIKSIDYTDMVNDIISVVDYGRGSLERAGNKYRIKAEQGGKPLTYYGVIDNMGPCIKVLTSIGNASVVIDMRPTTRKVVMPYDTDKYVPYGD